MVNPFQKIFPKKHVYEFNASSFENQLAAESVNYATTTAATTTATTKSTIIGATVASAALVVVAVVVITTAVVLTQPNNDPNASNKTTDSLILSYKENCGNTGNICNSQLGLSCKNGFCLCDDDSYFNTNNCSKIFKSIQFFFEYL